MKRKNLFVYSGLAGIVIFGITVYSCSKESQHLGENSQIQQEVIDEICTSCESYDFWLPDKTKIEKDEGKDENQIVFTAPEGYVYYGFATDSSLIVWNNKAQGGSVTVTCDCTNGSDNNCSPVGHNGTVNCVIEPDCTTCDRKEKAKDAITKTEYEILQGGFVNPSLGVSFAQPNEELPYAFEALLHYPEIKQKLDTFMLQFYEELDDIPLVTSDDELLIAPEGYKFVVLNVYGRALVTILPTSKSVKSAGGSTYSCPCNGTGNCLTKSKWAPGGSYYFCEKPNSNPCTEACNTMTVEDDESKAIYTYTYYFF